VRFDNETCRCMDLSQESHVRSHREGARESAAGQGECKLPCLVAREVRATSLARVRNVQTYRCLAEGERCVKA
jgi:hypothetical protein